MVALIFDAAFNAAGLWPYLRNFGSTSLWAMINEALGSSSPPSIYTRIVVACSLAVITSAAPEILWNQDE
jgi:hypothetical protein